MVQHDSFLPRSDLAQQLRVRVDDYSLQLSSVKDSRFWIRIEKTQTGQNLVTDFSYGEFDNVSAAEALRFAFGAAKRLPVETIIFRDIVPNENGDDRIDRIRRLREIVAIFARIERIFIKFESILNQGNKTTFEVRFEGI